MFYENIISLGIMSKNALKFIKLSYFNCKLEIRRRGLGLAKIRS